MCRDGTRTAPWPTLWSSAELGGFLKMYEHSLFLVSRRVLWPQAVHTSEIVWKIIIIIIIIIIVLNGC
jgi:hypothetical protein